MLSHAQQRLTVATPGRGFTELSRQLDDFLAKHQAESGIATVFVQHTSASLLIQERADPVVRDDLERFFSRLVPDGEPLFRHDDEGPDDMPAHVRAALTQTSLTIPVVNGRAALGQWQGLFLWEHRHVAHTRTVLVSFIGTASA